MPTNTDPNSWALALADTAHQEFRLNAYEAEWDRLQIHRWSRPQKEILDLKRNHANQKELITKAYIAIKENRCQS
jgi:hypothetical protein